MEKPGKSWNKALEFLEYSWKSLKPWRRLDFLIISGNPRAAESVFRLYIPFKSQARTILKIWELKT